MASGYERVTSDAPPAIQEMLELPYLWAQDIIGDSDTVLDVGGGEQRLGVHVLGGVDIDIDPSLNNSFTGSITDLPFTDNAYDTVVCFETIEHTNQPIHGLAELVRVAKKQVILGSVNTSGPCFVRGGIDIRKGKGNEFHLSEMNSEEFKWLVGGLNVQLYSSVETIYPDEGFSIVAGNFPSAIGNYAVITK